jgi:hypothetical protein
MMFLGLACVAQERTTLEGTWTLRAAEIQRPDGTRETDPSYGPKAQGLLMVDKDGRYSLQIFRPDRPKFASGEKKRGTPQEYEAALLGISTHVGQIVLDPSNQTIVFKIDHAAFPNWEHTEQKRKFQLSDGELTYQVPAVTGGTTAVSVWRRVGR